MRRRQFSAVEARRIALHAQGFNRKRPGNRANAGHLRRVVERLGLLQLDYVNVLIPAHRLVPYSRLGAYPHEAFDRAMYGNGRFTEQWAHEASIVPSDAWPLLQYRRDSYLQSPRSPLFKISNYKQYLAEVFDIVSENGASISSDMPQKTGPRRKPGDWHRSVGRWALEHHFGSGKLAVAHRLPNFQRVYDLPERLLPSQHLEREVAEPSAHRELLQRAARAFGIATTNDLADYFRMRVPEVRPRIRELAEDGTLQQVAVAGWDEPAWLHCEATLPRKVDTQALLSPFDPLVWYRPRAERLFDFHYRIEIYVPEAKRRWGYYVLPFLCGDRLCARVDLKADRQAGALLVRAAHLEAGVDGHEVSRRLAQELRLLADWLGLETIKVSRKGDLARDLAKAVAA